jgi:hypothetical protein
MIQAQKYINIEFFFITEEVISWLNAINGSKNLGLNSC